jgi:hypothetical protein
MSDDDYFTLETACEGSNSERHANIEADILFLSNWI